MSSCEAKLEESLRIQRDTQRLLQALVIALYGNQKFLQLNLEARL